MTAIAEPTTPTEVAPEPPVAAAPAPRAEPRPAPTPTEVRAPIRPARLTVAWLVLSLAGIALVLFAVGPLTENRDQRRLLDDYRAEIESATNEAFGLAGVETATEAPTRGAPVAILDIGDLHLRRVVVEGTSPSQTRQGPGHVVGTGGPGQPGNSVIVGRQALFGGAFADLDHLEVGDEILVSTVQGQSVYTVEHVGTHAIVADRDTETEAADAASATESTAPTTIDTAATDASTDEADAPTGTEDAVLPDGSLTPEQLYGPSNDDRLTLVTSASGAPWADDEALVVVATMEGTPFTPTPQGGRTANDDGRAGQPWPSASLVLALLAYAVAVVGAVWLHRHVPWRSAYLLTAPLLIALTIVVAEQLAAALPAWA